MHPLQMRVEKDARINVLGVLFDETNTLLGLDELNCRVTFTNLFRSNTLFLVA